VIASTRGVWKLIMVIPVPKLKDHTFALGGSRLGASLLEDGVPQGRLRYPSLV